MKFQQGNSIVVIDEYGEPRKVIIEAGRSLKVIEAGGKEHTFKVEDGATVAAKKAEETLTLTLVR